MSETPPAPADQSVSLGQYLQDVRKSRELSLRQVEVLTRKTVSNAYLSQIESGKVAQPSPNILHALANAYSVSYEQLMDMAGFLSAKEKERKPDAAYTTLIDMKLSLGEIQELVDYVHFRRAQDKKKVAE